MFPFKTLNITQMKEAVFVSYSVGYIPVSIICILKVNRDLNDGEVIRLKEKLNN